MHHQLPALLHAHAHDAVVDVGPRLLLPEEDAAPEPALLQPEGTGDLYEDGEHDRGDVRLLVVRGCAWIMQSND